MRDSRIQHLCAKYKIFHSLGLKVGLRVCRRKLTAIVDKCDVSGWQGCRAQMHIILPTYWVICWIFRGAGNEHTKAFWHFSKRFVKTENWCKQTYNGVGSSEYSKPEVATIAPVSVVHPPFVAVTSGSISSFASQSYNHLYSAHSSVGLWCYA